MALRKRPVVIIWLLPILIGLAGYNRVEHSPLYNLYRPVDITQLLGSGACFGAALAGIIMTLRRPRS